MWYIYTMEYHSVIKNEIKNTPKEINSRLDDAKEWGKDVEDRLFEIIQSEHQKEERSFTNE